jgi:hypothetical protein
MTTLVVMSGVAAIGGAQLRAIAPRTTCSGKVLRQPVPAALAVAAEAKA